MFKQVIHLRNNSLFNSRAAAEVGIKEQLNSENYLDGSIVLARYQETGQPIKSIAGIVAKYGTAENQQSVTILGTAEDLATEIARLEGILGASAGSTELSFSANTPYLSSLSAGDRDVVTALETLANALNNIDELIGDSLNKALTTAGESEVYTSYQEQNGIVTLNASNLTGRKLAGYTVGADNSGKIAATDTLGTALGKLQGQINGMDYTIPASSHVSGRPVTAVTETDGKIAVTEGAINATYVNITDSGSRFNATTVEAALAELDEKINDIGGEAKSYTIIEKTSELPSNVEKRYVLQQTVGTQVTEVGTAIDIYKDKSLITAKLSKATPTWDGTQTGAERIVDGTGEDVLALALRDENGTVNIVSIPVGSFLKESEFKDGLIVNNGTVSVKLSTNTESVKYLTLATETGNTNKVLKISGIDSAISNAVSPVQSEVDAIETAVGLNTNGTHKTTTGNYTSTATTIAGEIAALDAQTKTNTDAISALQNNSVTNIKVNEKTGTVTNHVAAVTIDGGDVKLTGYTQDTTTIRANTSKDAIVETDTTGLEIADTDTVNQAVAKLYRTIQLDENLIDTELDSLSDQIGALDTRIDTLEAKTIAAGQGINKTTSGNTDTISIKLDTTTAQATAQSNANNQYATTNGNVLQLRDNGLYLSSIWDCGTY